MIQIVSIYMSVSTSSSAHSQRPHTVIPVFNSRVSSFMSENKSSSESHAISIDREAHFVFVTYCIVICQA